MKQIPYFDYPHTFRSEEESLLAIITDIGRRGAFVLQNDLTQFEKNLAIFAESPFAVGVANATDGLTIALRAAGIGPGDEVIFCSHTFVATAAAIHHTGATPVPVECQADHLIDPHSVKKAITKRTKAILPTQLNGRTAEMDLLMAIAEENNLLLIEDAAQALGSRFRGRQAGTFGVASAISFFPAKSLGCLGDGGAVLVRNEELYHKIRLMRDHGRSATGEVVMWGVNSRLDNLQAAILDYRLKSFDTVIARRRKIAQIYQEELEATSQVVLPPGPNANSDHFDTFQNYEIEAELRDALKNFLREQGVGTLIQWGGKAVHEFPALGFQVKLPFTEKMFERCLMLPMNMSLADEDVRHICTVIRKFYG